MLPRNEHELFLCIELVGVFVILWLILTIVARWYEKRQNPLAHAYSVIRVGTLPLGTILFFLVVVRSVPSNHRTIKILETFFWFTTIIAIVSALKGILLARLGKGVLDGRVPGLFVDLVRFSLGIVGVFVVIAGVWEKNLGDFLTTLGVGSLVFGLALQETLGNLFAGIALFFEKPFAVGHWIKVGDVIGQVEEMNWRAVRVRTRRQDMVIIPNSVLGKERIENFSYPTPTHATLLNLGFSYEDPPNKVKQILLSAAHGTKSILKDPAPLVRTVGYGESAINYTIQFFISDFAHLPDIEEEFYTRVWYAARRNGLTLPYPTRTIYKTEIPLHSKPDAEKEVVTFFKGVAFFKSLAEEEFETLGREAVLLEYAHGEHFLSQGTNNSSLYIVRSGKVQVTLHTAEGAKQIAVIGPGGFFGEMSVLTGAKTTADVVALEDVMVAVIVKETLESLISARPSLAEELARIIHERKELLDERAGPSTVAPSASTNDNSQLRLDPSQLVEKIRRFFTK